MKKLFLLAIAVLAAMPIFAVTNTMNYQAIISNPDGTPAANRQIGMKFCIVSETATLFTEETTTVTTEQGLAEYAIGSNNLPNGISTIDWTTPGLRLEVWVDLNGGQNYTTAYSSTIQSVPTALYAEKSGDSQALRYQIDTTKADLETVIADTRYRIEDVRNLTEAYTDAKLAALESLIYSEISSLKSDISTLNNVIANLGGGSVDNAYLDEKIKDLQRYVDMVSAENRDRIDMVRAELYSYVANMADKADVDRLQAMLDTKIDALQNEIAKIKTTIDNLEIGDGNIDNALLQAKLDEIKSYVNAVGADNRVLINNVKAELDSTLEDLHQGLRDLRSYADAVSSENREIVNAAIASLETKMNSEISSLQEENNMLKDDIANLAAIIADLTKKVDALSK